MTQINSKIILVLGGINLLLCIVLDISPVIFLFSIIMWLLLLLILVSLESALLTLIFIRPSIDIIGYLSLPDWPMITLSPSIAIFTIIISFIYIYKNRTIFNNTNIPLIKSLIIVLFIYIGLTLTGISKLAGFQETIRLLSFIVLYFVGWIYVNKQNKFFNIIRVIIYGSIIPLIVAYIEYFSGSGLYTNPGFENRISATFGHPNVLAYYSVIILALISVIWFYKNNQILKLEREIFGIIGCLYVIVLLITFTRGAWFGLILFVFLMSSFQYRLKTLKISSVLIVLSIVLIFTYNFLASTNILDLPSLSKIPVINRVTGLFNSDPSDSVIWRLNMWRDAYNKALESPIIGFGTGSSETIIEQTRGTYRGSVEVHNDYIKIFLEQGIIGLIIYLAIIINILFTLYYRYIKGKNIYILTIAVLMTIIYVVSFWDNLLRGTVLMWLLFLLLGGVLHYNQLQNKFNQQN
jgi:O-antigen ligase